MAPASRPPALKSEPFHASLQAGSRDGPASVGPDVAALGARIDKVEAALATQKSETRVAPEAFGRGRPGRDRDNRRGHKSRLAAGAPFGPELAALQRLGVDRPGWRRQAVVNGAPTDAALAASFAALAQSVGLNVEWRAGGAVDRFLAHMRGLVQVRDLNETRRRSAGLVSQVEAETRRGDIAGALAAFGELPEAARQAAGELLSKAAARQAADAALQGIREIGDRAPCGRREAVRPRKRVPARARRFKAETRCFAC